MDSVLIVCVMTNTNNTIAAGEVRERERCEQTVPPIRCERERTP